MDQPSARILLNLDGAEKSHILWNRTESYYEKLRITYLHIKKDNKSEYLYFAFITLCSATLEYSLNFILTDFCLNHFGKDDYKQYAEGYINLPFAKKLLMTPTIISMGKYRFNTNHTSYKSLTELITLRNRILHNKEFLQEFEHAPIYVDSQQETLELQIPANLNHIDTLSKDLCLRLGDTMEKFRELLMIPALASILEANEILI